MWGFSCVFMCLIPQVMKAFGHDKLNFNAAKYIFITKKRIHYQGGKITYEKIGFIGLGMMGKPMAVNLLKAGYPLTVWNRTRSKMEELAAMGASKAESPKDVAERSDVVITMVSDSSAVENVVLSPNGVIEGAKPGLILIDMSTISPIVTRRIAQELAKKNVKMLDAPVSGGVTGAQEGILSIMVGDLKKSSKNALIYLMFWGKITYMGSNGMGQTTKICNQVICALNILAACEGLILGAKAGIDPEKLLNVLTAGSANSRLLSKLGPKMIERDFRPGFKVKHLMKDLKLALSLANELDLPLLGTSTFQQILKIVKEERLEEKGTQTIIVAFEKLSGKNSPNNF